MLLVLSGLQMDNQHLDPAVYPKKSRTCRFSKEESPEQPEQPSVGQVESE